MNKWFISLLSLVLSLSLAQELPELKDGRCFLVNAGNKKDVTGFICKDFFNREAILY
jgi:hypothetical protein